MVYLKQFLQSMDTLLCDRKFVSLLKWSTHKYLTGVLFGSSTAAVWYSLRHNAIRFQWFIMYGNILIHSWFKWGKYTFKYNWWNFGNAWGSIKWTKTAVDGQLLLWKTLQEVHQSLILAMRSVNLYPIIVNKYLLSFFLDHFLRKIYKYVICLCTQSESHYTFVVWKICILGYLAMYYFHRNRRKVQFFLTVSFLSLRRDQTDFYYCPQADSTKPVQTSFTNQQILTRTN